MKNALLRGIPVAVFALLGAAGNAWAQWCVDTPIRPGRPGVQASTGFAESATTVGLHYRAAADRLQMNAGYWAGLPDGGTVSHIVGLGVSYDLPLAEGRFCPRAGFSLSNELGLDDVLDRTTTSITFGFTAGTVAYEGDSVRLSPFVHPSYVFASTVSRIDNGWHRRWDVGAGALLQMSDRSFASGTLHFDRDGYDGLTLAFGWLLR